LEEKENGKLMIWFGSVVAGVRQVESKSKINAAAGVRQSSNPRSPPAASLRKARRRWRGRVPTYLSVPVHLIARFMTLRCGWWWGNVAFQAFDSGVWLDSHQPRAMVKESLAK
jgi:hypothetical protein